ncbi:DMT family transporter [Ferruginibacter albus]|uniref:DMT family transporter n=1 Tax=Ferruginibacter albus TaxID=2875540 RepID=UPI001CC6F841|nr:DMT family transporter [Ferruginibacter albus]UAY51756.1 DMT family transporter [Ferruginibacter albus]
MQRDFLSWLIFIILSIIWGSSFILMKVGLQQLTPYQVAAIRILSSGMVLSPLAMRYFTLIPRQKLLYVFLSGFIGNLIPAFLFCLAEERIDSALSGTLNSLTPIFVLVTGVLFFNLKTSFQKTLGIIIAFSGTALLFTGKAHVYDQKDIVHMLYVVLATVLYGFNVNMVHKKLEEIPSIHIVAVALAMNAVLALLILLFTGYFNLPLANNDVLLSTAAAVVLGAIGTAVATIMFYNLIKRTGAIFTSLVAYGMPAIAIFWGVIAGENIGIGQIACLLIILFGVYWTKRSK